MKIFKKLHLKVILTTMRVSVVSSETYVFLQDLFLGEMQILSVEAWWRPSWNEEIRRPPKLSFKGGSFLTPWCGKWSKPCPGEDSELVSKATSPGHESYGTVPAEDKPQMRSEGQTAILIMLCQDHGEVTQETLTLTHFLSSLCKSRGWDYF